MNDHIICQSDIYNCSKGLTKDIWANNKHLRGIWGNKGTLMIFSEISVINGYHSTPIDELYRV